MLSKIDFRECVCNFLARCGQVGGVYSVSLPKTSELHENQGIGHVIMVR